MERLHINQKTTNKTLFMTKSGLDNLKKQLDALMSERLEMAAHLRTLAQEDKADPLILIDETRRLESIENELSDITTILQRVEPIVKSTPTTCVQIGSEVTLKRNAQHMTYTIVCSLEIDPMTNKISEESPLGHALLSKKLHDTVTVLTRKGKESRYEIIDIK
jgi:transcription elongation factor GreA